MTSGTVIRIYLKSFFDTTTKSILGWVLKYNITISKMNFLYAKSLLMSKQAFTVRYLSSVADELEEYLYAMYPALNPVGIGFIGVLKKNNFFYKCMYDLSVQLFYFGHIF